MNPFDPAPPVSAEAEAFDYVLGKIRRGELRPGMRLKSEEIASEIGMSRMPVREAFGRLYQLGVLTLRPNRGAVVTEFSSDQFLELFEIRSVLEGLAMRRAAGLVTGRDISELEDMLDRMARSETEVEPWLLRHGEFHAQIARLSGARRLAKEIEKLHLLLEVYMRLWLLHANKAIDAIADHRALLDALAARNPERAEQAMREHVLSTAPALIASLGAV